MTLVDKLQHFETLMKKSFNFRAILICLMAIILLPLFSACSNSHRPNFNLNSSQDFDSKNSQNNELINNTSYVTITYEDGISISSSADITDNENAITIKSGSKIKVELDLPQFKSTQNELFYFDTISSSIVCAIKINEQIIPLSKIDRYIKITSDTNISLIKSNLALSAIMICENFDSELYNNFNKSDNNRNELLNFEDDKIIFSSNIHYIAYNNLSSNYSTTTNVSNLTLFNIENKSISSKINVFLETTEISFVFVYKDESNNLFLSEVNKVSKFANTKNETNSNIYSILSDNFTTINLEFVKYYLPNII